MKKVGNLDLITIGRSSVDLYGSQIGGRLEDMRSFQKYIGGSPTNIAAGAARLGLKSAVITRVGNEHMGRFILEELKKEGVNTEGIRIDKNNDDQKRTLTPNQAYKNGSDWLVIGRPITKGNIKKNIQKLIDHINK